MPISMGLRCGAISGEEPANSGNCLAGRGRNRIAQNPTPQVIDSNMQDLMDLTTKALLPQAVRASTPVHTVRPGKQSCGSPLSLFRGPECGPTAPTLGEYSMKQIRIPCLLDQLTGVCYASRIERPEASVLIRRQLVSWAGLVLMSRLVQSYPNHQDMTRLNRRSCSFLRVRGFWP